MPIIAEEESALITRAALEVSAERGQKNLPVPLAEPLPLSQRQYFYTVGDEHPLSEKYGAQVLSAILVETKTPHLTDRNLHGKTKSPRYGMRYADKEAVLDPRLEGFVSSDAQKAWKQDRGQRQVETNALRVVSMSLKGVTSQEQAKKILPSPEKEPENLEQSSDRSISKVSKSSHHSR